MAQPHLFCVLPDSRRAREAAERLFETVEHELRALLPETAEILHVGATAIPGCLTKGDLDVVIRVEHADFRASETILADRYARNLGSARTEDFAAFEDGGRTPHLGIQLTAKGAAFDIFHRFAATLRADPDLVRRYNALKIAYDGQPMDDYRAAKDAFVAEALISASVQPDSSAP